MMRLSCQGLVTWLLWQDSPAGGFYIASSLEPFKILLKWFQIFGINTQICIILIFLQHVSAIEIDSSKGMAIAVSTNVELIPREPAQFLLRLAVGEYQPHPHCTPADFLTPTYKLLGQTSNPSCKASLLCKMPQQVSACPRCPVTGKQKAHLISQGK